MFYIFSKARCTGVMFEGTHAAAILLENIAGEKIVVYLKKTDEFYELIRSGEWVFVKLFARVRSKVKSNGGVFVETRIYAEKVRELDKNELEKLDDELKQIAVENQSKIKSSREFLEKFL